MGDSAYIKGELAILRHRAALAADEIHNGTENLADPEIVVEKTKQNSEAQNNAMIDKILQQIEEMGRDEISLDEDLEEVMEDAEGNEEAKEKEEVNEEGKEEVLEEEDDEQVRRVQGPY